MKQRDNVVRVPGCSASAHPPAQHVHTTYDSFGAVLADYTFFPRPHVLYVRWHGHVTGAELVRAGQTGLRLNQQWQPRGLLQDLRQSSGEWGGDGAGTWLEHEWIPGIHAQCPHLRGIAVLLDPETPLAYTNAQFLAQLDQQFDFQVFYSLLAAWRWLDQAHAARRGKPYAATAAATGRVAGG